MSTRPLPATPYHEKGENVHRTVTVQPAYNRGWTLRQRQGK